MIEGTFRARLALLHDLEPAMPDPKDRSEPDTNEPIPTPADDSGVASGDESEPSGPSDLPSPEVDPDAERDPTDKDAPGEPPDDLDDGPLVA